MLILFQTQAQLNKMTQMCLQATQYLYVLTVLCKLPYLYKMGPWYHQFSSWGSINIGLAKRTMCDTAYEEQSNFFSVRSLYYILRETHIEIVPVYFLHKTINFTIFKSLDLKTSNVLYCLNCVNVNEFGYLLLLY